MEGVRGSFFNHLCSAASPLQHVLTQSTALLLFTNTEQGTFFPTIPLCNLRLVANTPTEQKTKHSNRQTD